MKDKTMRDGQEWCNGMGSAEAAVIYTIVNDYARQAALFAEMEETLRSAKLQIQYMHEKFTITGSGAQVLARITAVLAAVEKENHE